MQRDKWGLNDSSDLRLLSHNQPTIETFLQWIIGPHLSKSSNVINIPLSSISLLASSVPSANHQILQLTQWKCYQSTSTVIVIDMWWWRHISTHTLSDSQATFSHTSPVAYFDRDSITGDPHDLPHLHLWSKFFSVSSSLSLSLSLAYLFHVTPSMHLHDHRVIHSFSPSLLIHTPSAVSALKQSDWWLRQWESERERKRGERGESEWNLLSTSIK